MRVTNTKQKKTGAPGEGARNKTLKEGSGAEEHRHPKSGDNSHFHPTDNKGKKKPSSTHHQYPD